MRIDAVAGAPAGEARPGAENVRDAAAQFESLLITQLLKSMREAGSGGWLGTGDDQAGATMMELAEEHLARVLASQGGLGLANLVVEGLDRAAPAQENGASVR
jgi:Rod binding domain-containing protein